MKLSKASLLLLPVRGDDKGGLKVPRPFSGFNEAHDIPQPRCGTASDFNGWLYTVAKKENKIGCQTLEGKKMEKHLNTSAKFKV